MTLFAHVDQIPTFYSFADKLAVEVCNLIFVKLREIYDLFVA